MAEYSYEPVRRVALRGIRAGIRARLIVRAVRQATGWTVACGLLLVLGVVEHSWVAASALFVVMGIAVAQWWFEAKAFELSNVAETDSLSGLEFERWLEDFFEAIGFDEVQRTPYTGDFGADLIVTWRGMRTAVQAKSGHQRVGVAAVQQAAAAQSFYGCERAMVVSNRDFTTAAIVLADATGVVLRDRSDLARKLRGLSG